MFDLKSLLQFNYDGQAVSMPVITYQIWEPRGDDDSYVNEICRHPNTSSVIDNKLEKFPMVRDLSLIKDNVIASSEDVNDLLSLVALEALETN